MPPHPVAEHTISGTDQNMDVTRVIAVLAVVAAVGSVTGLAATRLAGRTQLAAAWQVLAPWFAVAVAVAATTASLYLSESRGFVPCKWCWYQRIIMYPLGPLLLWRAVTRNRSFDVPFLGYAALGSAASLWHWLQQHVPSLAEGTSCDPTAPCTGIWFEHFGFVTIPAAAGLCFVAIAALLVTAAATTTPTGQPGDDATDAR